MVTSFFNLFFETITRFDDFFWSFIGIPSIILFGLFLSFKSKWIQILNFNKITHLFFVLFNKKDENDHRGVHPIRAFFASIAGSIGIGNVVGVCTAVQIGGPGAILWLWVASILGAIVKYSEIYLGLKYRVQNNKKSYDGGPMYYLKHVDKSGFLSLIFCVILCIYGVEIYMFRIMTHTIVYNWGFDYYVVVATLLCAMLLAAYRGVAGVGRITSILIPLFVSCFIGISLWIFLYNMDKIPALIHTIFSAAFNGHAPLGAFAGSTAALAISQGMKRACYTGDIGIGYASIMMAETEDTKALEQQAALVGIFGVIFDTFVICTTSLLLITLTGLWHQNIHQDQLVAQALATYIPGILHIWPIFIFSLGFSSSTAYLTAGKKAACYISPKYGTFIYTLYAITAFIIFSFFGSETHILTIMSCAGGLLLSINLYGIIKLRNRISFDLQFKNE